MYIVSPVRQTLRKIPFLRNRRFQFSNLSYQGMDLFEVSPFSGCSLLARNEDLKIIDEVFQKRRYATLFPFHQEAVVIDVGAHCGFFSVFAGKNLVPGSRILAFEPSSTNRDLARKNLDRNDLGSAELYPQGVSGETAKIPFYSNSNSAAQHSIIQEYSATPEDGCESIEVLGLADLFHRHDIGRCDFMKLDCEGAEYSFLYDAPHEILDLITTISMEFHDLDDNLTTGTELAAYLVSRNFSIVDFRYEPTRQNRNYGSLLATRKW